MGEGGGLFDFIIIAMYAVAVYLAGMRQIQSTIDAIFRERLTHLTPVKREYFR